MRLSVKNLGPLREAEVDLSQPLIILTGPNNTGKTWFSWCVYGVHAARTLNPEDGLVGMIPEEIFDEEGVDLSSLIMENREHIVSRISSEACQALPPLFATEPELFENTKLALLEGPHTPEDLLRQRKRILRGAAVVPLNQKYSVYVRFQEERHKLTLRERNGEDIDGSSEPRLHISQLTQDQRTVIVRGIRRVFFRRFARRILPSCIIFPAERIAVNIFARELSLRRSELVDDMLEVENTNSGSTLQAELLYRRARRYPWPIRDSLRIADDLAANSVEQSAFADLATDLETSVMGGKIGISKQGDMTFSPSQTPERALGIHLTASVVKSLSSLVFYFRYLAKAGEFLIIDEPELNLHPDNQRRVARVLAKAVNRGFKIMLSTHSDCLIREFNHLIMLSQDSDVARELRQKFEYEDSSLLTPDKVGVYLFNEDHATPIPVREDGFEVKTIDDEINKMNFVTQTLYVRLFD